MKIRIELLKTALEDYIDEVFNGFNQDLANMINRVGAKMKLGQMVTEYGTAIADTEGFINIAELENYVMPEVRKLGIIEVNGVGKRFSFNESDVTRLFSKIKEKCVNE